MAVTITTVKFKGSGDEFPFVALKTQYFSFKIVVLYDDGGQTKSTALDNVDLIA